MSRGPNARSKTLPIRDYALIGDCRSAALVSKHGSIDWLCWPHFSAPSLFARLLDEDGGYFSIEPQGAFETSRRYLENTAVLETTFRTREGTARLLDFFPILDQVDSLQPMREIVRIVEGVSGEVVFEVSLDPRPVYGRTRVEPVERGPLGWHYAWSNEFLALRAEVHLSRQDHALQGVLAVRAGDRRRFALAYVQAGPGLYSSLGGAADARLHDTVRFWRQWTDRCTYRGPYRAAVLRSLITLKLLTFCLSGAIVAAPTTSLPEALGAKRNWDYRYCWLRDAGLTAGAFTQLGYLAEARAFLGWLLHATRLTWPQLQIVYDEYGKTKLDEQCLEHLRGYADSRPVRIGNRAHTQCQLDAYGQVILAAQAVTQAGGTLDPLETRMLTGLGQVVCQLWTLPDNGIWEAPDPRRHYTFSKFMCWVALDRLLTLEQEGILTLGAHAPEFRRHRELLRVLIDDRGFSASIGSYVQEFGGVELDASLLLMPCLGYQPASAARMMSTYDRIHERLGANGLLYRYEPTSEGIASVEGAFSLCTFWAVEVLARRGEVSTARQRFEKALQGANEVGLFAEEVDPRTGEALGNFPQAFSHTGLIQAANALARASQSVERTC